MTKRSAITMAAGLALALLVGVAAITLTFGGASVASAGGQHKPIVKHQVQTVTVHRKADAPSPSGIRIVHLGSTTAMPTSTSGSSDDGFENEGIDDGFEDGSFGTSSGSTSGASLSDD
jgi:hypothetical protein